MPNEDSVANSGGVVVDPERMTNGAFSSTARAEAIGNEAVSATTADVLVPQVAAAERDAACCETPVRRSVVIAAWAAGAAIIAAPNMVARHRGMASLVISPG